MITIVVLLILAGITITLVFSENGIIKKAINAKEANEEGTVKEEIALALLQMRTDKYDEEYNLENIKEWLPEYLDRGQLGELKIENGKLLGEYKGYEFEIDSNYQISYIGKITGIRISYTLNPEGYTKENITLTINVTSTQGTIENIEAPEGLTKNEDGTYTITKNGTYKFTATDSAENDKDIDIEINTIDKLAPKDFEPTIVEVTKTSIKLLAETEDNGCSGIAGYRFSKNNGNTYSDWQENGEFEFTDLEEGTTYNISIQVKDRAENVKTVNILELIGDKYYLIKDGITKVSFVLTNHDGILSSYGNSISLRDGYIYFNSSDSEPRDLYHRCGYHTEESINLSKYSTLYFNGYISSTNKNCGHLYTSTSNLTTGIFEGNKDGVEKYLQLETTKEVHQIDISNLDKECYIGVCGSNRYIYIYDMWLEK